jgi:hypothetical protein
LTSTERQHGRSTRYRIEAANNAIDAMYAAEADDYHEDGIPPAEWESEADIVNKIVRNISEGGTGLED